MKLKTYLLIQGICLIVSAISVTTLVFELYQSFAVVFAMVMMLVANDKFDLRTRILFSEKGDAEHD